MKMPVIQGIIERRILANYQVEPHVLQRILPAPFRPKLINGVGIAGICLIRLKNIRPAGIQPEIGLTSENAAHRIAVEWDEDGVQREGVYIPRRDTSSYLNVFTGGRIFPGVHHHAHFKVVEDDTHFQVALESHDHAVRVLVAGEMADRLPATSIFGSLATASDFFEAGSMGYSATAENGKYHGLELRSRHWQVTPLTIQRIESSFFDDRALFPQDSIQFDCALLMQNINHEWHAQETLCCEASY